ncbi:unknown [Acidiphilium sp. CAG:727]|nr:unknown [Acidiphilium sp. CAG:727]
MAKVFAVGFFEVDFAVFVQDVKFDAVKHIHAEQFFVGVQARREITSAARPRHCGGVFGYTQVFYTPFRGFTRHVRNGVAGVVSARKRVCM